MMWALISIVGLVAETSVIVVLGRHVTAVRDQGRRTAVGGAVADAQRGQPTGPSPFGHAAGGASLP
jgi:hypothetical protein